MTEWRRLTIRPYRNYEVSSEGAIRRNGRELLGYVDRYGYRTVLLSYAGLSKRHKVHRLVCEAFHGPAPTGCEAAHKDGRPQNNAAENLAWLTHKENIAQKRSHGSMMNNGGLPGEAHPAARLSHADILAIRASSLSSRKIAQQYGVSQPHIVRIRAGLRWGPQDIAENQGNTAS